jgi:HSP20 family molecular chaperone IbpA
MSLTNYYLNDVLSDFVALGGFLNEGCNSRASFRTRGIDAFKPRYAANAYLTTERGAHGAHRMDLHYDKDTNNVHVAFELPGLQKEDVSIEVHNNALTVSGERRAHSERNDDGYVVRERQYGKFARTLSLPQGLKVSFRFSAAQADVLTKTFAERGHQSVHGKRSFEHRLPEVIARNRVKEGCDRLKLAECFAA